MPPKSNTLPIWGNEASMNLNPLILTNIQSSPYFKNELFKLKTYHEVIDEIYYKVRDEGETLHFFDLSLFCSQLCDFWSTIKLVYCTKLDRHTRSLLFSSKASHNDVLDWRIFNFAPCWLPHARILKVGNTASSLMVNFVILNEKKMQLISEICWREIWSNWGEILTCLQENKTFFQALTVYVAQFRSALLLDSASHNILNHCKW